MHSALIRREFQTWSTVVQYAGKHFTNVKRKGKAISHKVFLSKDVRETLNRYIEQDWGRKPGPLFCSKSGGRLERQAVDDALKAIAAQANASLPAEQAIHLSAHVLRHTFLRKVVHTYGVEYAKELARHTSERYIWRYVQPSEEERQRPIKSLF